MAHQGRCSARRATTILVATLLVSLLLHLETTQAAFIVGNTSGWTFRVSNWTNGKSFKAGDILIFKYDPSLHNVVTVDAGGYNSCTASSSSKSYSSGNDRIKLSKGHNYFICTFSGHCGAGMMKLAANAS